MEHACLYVAVNQLSRSNIESAKQNSKQISSQFEHVGSTSHALNGFQQLWQGDIAAYIRRHVTACSDEAGARAYLHDIILAVNPNTFHSVMKFCPMCCCKCTHMH